MQQRITHILQQRIRQDDPAADLLQALQRIARGSALSSDDTRIRDIIVQLHTALGQAADGSLDFQHLPNDYPDAVTTLIAQEFASATTDELRCLYLAIGRLLYGDNWQPTAS